MHIADGSVRGSFRRGDVRRDRNRRDHEGALFAPYWWPLDDPGGYEQAIVETAPADTRPPIVLQSAAPERVPGVPKIIEVPPGNSANSAVVAKPSPTTIFILKDGEHLQASRFLLRADALSVTVNRQPRTIALDSLDLDATLTANRERGIDLRIPADPNEISLSF